jgi:hypothetical protein
METGNTILEHIIAHGKEIKKLSKLVTKLASVPTGASVPSVVVSPEPAVPIQEPPVRSIPKSLKNRSPFADLAVQTKIVKKEAAAPPPNAPLAVQEISQEKRGRGRPRKIAPLAV